MKHFNLIKSLTRVMNNSKGLLILCLSLVVFGVNEAWGATWYATAYVEAVPQKGGYVKVVNKGLTYIDEGVKEGDINSPTNSRTNSTYNWSSSGDVDFSAYAKNKAGYTFKGWSSSSTASSGDMGDNDHYYRYTFSQKSTNKNSPGPSVYRYAIFTPNTYTITFDKQYGTGGSNSVTATYDAAMPSASAPIRVGYTFQGYFDAASGGNKYYNADMSSAQAWNKTGNTTLYAHWTAISYNVQYNANGGSGSMSNQSFKFDEQKSLTANSLTNSYTISFDGNGGSTPSEISSTRSFEGWEDRGSIVYNGIEYKYTDFDAPYYANTYGDLFTAFGYNKYNLLNHYVNNGSGEGRSCKGDTPGLYPNQTSVANLSTTNGATIPLYAHWSVNGAAITLPSASKNNSVLVGWYNGDNFVGEPGDSYTPSEDVTLIAHWASKYDITVTGSNQSMKVGDAQENAFNFVHAENPTPKISIISIDPINNGDGQVIEYDATNNKIIAHNAGTATICFEQAGTSTMNAGTSATFTFTISKIANTLAVANASPTMYVGDNLVDKISTNSDATINVSSNDETVAHYDLGSQTIIAQNTGNQSFNSKEVTITISQAATYKYTEASKTIKVTIKKHIPTFTWSNATLYHNQTYNDFFTTNCSNTLTVKSSSDDNVAYLVDGSNAQKLNLKTLTKAASAILTVTQAENYYWAEHTESKTITPSNQSDHVPFTINSSTTYNNQHPAHGGAGSASWSDGISFDQGGFNWDDNYVDLSFTGIPEKLSFTTSKQTGATGPSFYVKEYVNNSWSSEKWSSSDASSSTVTVPLSPNATKIRLCYSGNLSAVFKNVTVTELKTFSTDKSELDFGSTNKKDMPCADQTFTFNYANVGHKVTLSTSDNHFSVSPASITNIGGEKYGSQIITVSYSTAEVHSATNAKLTIKDELGNSKEVTLTGNTTKKAQTINWEKPYDIEEPAIPIGKKITGAATASSKLGVIYESSDPTIIEIVDDGKAFKAVKEGSATITAKQVGTEDWEETSTSKTFKGTNKIIQVISWNQNFTRLLTDYGTQSLTAIVNLENAETGEQTYSKERSDLITYTSQNTSVVSVSGSILTIIGKGETTLTATVPGDDLYESATVIIPIKVREPSAGCEDVLLGNDFGSDEYEFFHYSLTSDMEKVVKIDRTTSAIPGVLSFQHKGKKWGLNYSGEIVVYESTNNGQSWTKLGEITPTVDKYNTQPYPLSRNATHIKFFRGKSATGYHYIQNVEISPAQFIESNISDNKIEFGVISVNSVDTKDFSLNYANVKDNLSVNKTNSDITLSCGEVIDLDCGATGTTPITITFNPQVVGDFSDDIQFLDKNSGKNYTLKVTAKVEKSTQHITWNPSKTEYLTIDEIELDATASSNNPVQYYVKDGTDVADFVNGVLTIKKDGQITIRAYEPGDALWAAAADVDKTFTIRKTNLHFDPLPKAATITYPQTLSESVLTDGVVKDEDGNVVAGTIAWTNPATQLNAGENQSQGITFTPAANPAWYNALSSSVSVTVQKAQPNALAHASEIVYGAKVETSVLTNDGTTEGAWSWADSEKERVLGVGTHEGLQVHFKPVDTNYNEIDGTVSLTVNAATPVITWTAEQETATVHETKTFTANSTNSETPVVYSITEGADYAAINASTGEVTMLKAGTITIQASQAATANFKAATITTTCTISVASTTITTLPTANNVVSGILISEIALEGGVAQNTVNNQAVEGVFAVTGGDLVNVGEQTLTITFTPNETDKYASCSTSMKVEVLQRTPTAEEVGTPSAGNIVYGNPINSSVLTGSNTITGTWSWVDEDANKEIPNVGTYSKLKVTFTPQDGNVKAVNAEVSLTVQRAASQLQWVHAPSEADIHERLTFVASSNHEQAPILYSVISGDAATIDETTGELSFLSAGVVTIQASQAESDNYTSASISQTLTITGVLENEFTNASGDCQWSTAANWSSGQVPTPSPTLSVLITNNLNIDSEIEVGSLSIAQNAKVTVCTQGNLKVYGETTRTSSLGNLYVQNGGQLHMSDEASLSIADFCMETSVGGDGIDASAQVFNVSHIHPQNAYLDINLDPSGKVKDDQWYGIAVPFTVHLTGIARKDASGYTSVKDGRDFMVYQYDMDKRLQTGKGWVRTTTDMQPGIFYYFTVNGTNNTYRFHAASSQLVEQTSASLTTNGTGANANWNGVSNSLFHHANVAFENVDDADTYVQVYLNGKSAYQVVKTTDAAFVVGCPFFVQATKATELTLSDAGEQQALYAPQRASGNTIPAMRVQLINAANEKDQLYLKASETAENAYIIGHDLAKAGVATSIPQMWISAYGKQLCVHEAPLNSNETYCPLGLYAPKAGTYTIAGSPSDNATLYLTINGQVVWNLSQSSYELDLPRGTSTEYGLLLQYRKSVPTAIDETKAAGNNAPQKVVHDGKLYILTPESVFNAQGQKVK